MPEPEATGQTPSGAVGHLSVHLEHMHPRDVLFSFETQAPRMSSAMGISGAFHVIAIVLVFVLAAWLPASDPLDLRNAVDNLNKDIIWTAAPGPGGGGGGGGNRMPEPPRTAEQPGKDKITVPVTKPPEIQPFRNPEDALPKQDFNIPALTLASAEQSLAGIIDTSAASSSLGPGSGGGAGSGAGTGIGSGSGSGLGPGWGGGSGGGAYRPGAGIELPRQLLEVKPKYTAEAMRAKIQGTAVLDCVVKADGNVGECEVVRSLDSTFGLDHEAVIAARQWKFVPGKRLGQAVAVLVTIELTFTLR